MADAQQQAEKNSWPELVGKPWQEAEEVIKKEFPKMMVQVCPEDSMVTMDFRTDRVRIFQDADGKVVRAPMIG